MAEANQPQSAPPGGHMKTLILIDGHSLAYRMHFALERTNMRTEDNRPTWAVYGFFNAIFSLLKKIQPDAIAVSFDVGRITFRNALFSDYKAHRESMPDEMRTQMGLIRQGVELLGIPIYEKENYEADDVIGTLACKAAHEGFWVQILTGDQDAFQLVDDLDPENPAKIHAGKIEVLIPSRMPREEMKIYDRQGVFEKWGIYPEQVIDFKGLKGDTSDNIPGIPGVGDKTAVKLLSEYGTLENIYTHVQDMPVNKLREKLETYKDQAFLSKQLATIDRQVPMDVDWNACHLAIPDFPALLAFLEAMEFKTYIKQAATLLAPFLKNLPAEWEKLPGGGLSAALLKSASQPNPASKGMVFPGGANRPAIRTLDSTLNLESGCIEVPHTIVTTLQQLRELVALIEKHGVFALDVETTGLDVHTVDLAGIAISVAEGFESYQRPAENILNLKEYPASFEALRLKPASSAELPPESFKNTVQNFYIPIRQTELASELNETAILDALKPVLCGSSIVKMVHNAKFECNIFRKLGYPLQGLVFDTIIASYIDDPDRRHGLKSLGLEVLSQPMAEIKGLIGSGKKMILFSEVSVEKAALYATCDTFVTLELARYFLEKLDEKQWTLFYEIEMPLAHVLSDLEWTGVSLDTAYLSNLSRELDERLQVLEREIWILAGCEFNLNSPKQVGDVLFDKLGIAATRKTKSKTAYSTDVKVLEQLADRYEIVRELLEYRQLFKLKSTYVDALPSLLNPKTHRLHTSFNQTVTATGRLSSSNPNLQNIPIRSELGRQIRQAFVPENRDGWVLLSADYSQIELRLLAHFSEDPHLVEAFNQGEDIHAATASLVFGLPIDKVTKEQRYRAKTVNFGVIYGQSPYGLAQQLKIPQVEAAQFIQLYFSRYRKVKDYIETIKAQAHEQGKVSTLSGRTRDLSRDLTSTNRSIREFAERAAFNTPLQGSAADLMKIAMIRLQRKLRQEKLESRVILQVHDELVLEVTDDELERVKALVSWAMELDQPLRVPLVVDIYVGPNWME
jgi:DNA polymerase-1